MKALRKTLLWMSYIIAAPVLVVITTVILVQALYANVRNYGKLNFIDAVQPMIEGLIEGHRINMWKVEHYDDIKNGNWSGLE